MVEARGLVPAPGEPAILFGVSEAPMLGEASRPGEAPRVAWDGGAWWIAWGDAQLVLDGEATLRAVLNTNVDRATGLAVDACEHVVAGDASGASEVVLYSSGIDTAIARARVVGTSAAVAAHRAGWLVATTRTGSRDDTLRVELRGAAALASLGQIEWSAPRLRSPHVAEVDGRALVVAAEQDGIHMHAVDPRRGTHLQDLHVMAANVWMRGAITTLVRGSRLWVAASDGEAIHVAVIDPSGARVEAGPVAALRSTAHGVQPGLAAIPEADLVALCAPVGPGPWGGADVLDTVTVQLLDHDARPIGPRVDVMHADAVHGVDCAWNGRELLVAYTAEVDGEPMLAARRMRFETGLTID